MKKRHFIIKVLYENKELTSKEILNLYYENCSDDVDIKRDYYIKKQITKTENQLRNQIYAEIKADLWQASPNCTTKWADKNPIFIIDKSTNITKYRLNEHGIERYNEIFGLDETELGETDEIELGEIELDEHNDELKDNSIGIVYFLKSKTHKDTFKIGVTNRTIEERVRELQLNPKYGSYNLVPVFYVKLKNYTQVEQVCHKFFENFRLCKKNDLFIDTELFKTDLDLLSEFKYFLKVNYIEHYRLKDDVIECKEWI